MRMSVFLIGCAVRGPARVRNAGGASFDRTRGDQFLEIPDFTFNLADFKAAGVGIDHSDAAGIISAVFKAFQTVDEDGDGGFLADITDDSAHIQKDKG